MYILVNLSNHTTIINEKNPSLYIGSGQLFILFWFCSLSFCIYIVYEKTEGTINNGQSRDIGKHPIKDTEQRHH